MNWTKLEYSDDTEMKEKTCGHEFQLYVPIVDCQLVVHQIPDKDKWRFFSVKGSDSPCLLRFKGFKENSHEYDSPEAACAEAVLATKAFVADLKTRLDEVVADMSNMGDTRPANSNDPCFDVLV